MMFKEPRAMCFRLRPLTPDHDGDHWQWTIYSYPDLAFLRDGQISGVRETAALAAREAVRTMGGIVEILKEA